MQKLKKTLALFAILSLVLMGVPVGPGSLAAPVTMTNVSDTITDSKPGATTDHEVDFTTATTTPSNGTIEILFPSGFDLTGADVTCPNGSGQIDGQTAKCTLNANLPPTSTQVTVSDVVNPSAGFYKITITTKTSGGTVLDYGEAMVAIVSGVTVKANVAATLSFEIKGVNAGDTNPEVDPNVTSTSSTIDFLTVNVDTQYVAAQKLVVNTNANGFTVKVWQDQNLTNAMGNDIDRFKDGVSPSDPTSWAAPTSTPGSENTYGHFGLRSDDTDIEKDYGTNLWIGFEDDGSNYQREVMKSDRAVVGENDNQHYGWDYVEYALQISALQEAGDYSNVLTYICTPTY